MIRNILQSLLSVNIIPKKSCIIFREIENRTYVKWHFTQNKMLNSTHIGDSTIPHVTF